MGNEIPDQNYGEGQSAIPSSVSVTDSNRVCAVQATPDDPIREQIVRQGIGPVSLDPTQQRTLDARNVPDHAHMGSNRSRQAGGVNAIKGASLPSKLGTVQAEPARQPPSGGQLKLKG